MTIKYHAGRRIQGTSNSVTNWVEASGTNGTGAGQYDSSNTSGDNSFNYDTTNNEIDFDVVRTSNTPNCMMKDITSSTNGLGTALSTTNWRMRFKIYWDNWEDKGDITLWLGLCSFSRSEAINGANSNDVRKPTGGDNIGLMFTNANLSNNCWNNLKFYYGENEDDTTRFGGDSTNHAVDLEVANTILSSGNYNCNKPTDDTYYWCEIIRDGSTVTFNCSKTAYGNSDVCGASNSATGKTTSGTASSTFGTTRPLKYFYVGKTGGTGGSAHIQGMIRDLQIENTASSSIDRGQLTNVQVGSRFEETDTRKMYHKNIDEYKVHSFTSGTSTFAVTGSGDVEVLVIGAGAGGSADNYGGGGAGGMSEKSGHAVTAQSYSVTIGSGGAGGAQGGSIKGSNGNTSSFDSIVSNGGGAGGINSSSGNDGGSGGGCGTTTNGQTGGNTTQGDTNGATGYGFDGGDSPQSGGGGAGQVGQTPNGGNGRANSITGTSVYYAGGGASVSGTGGNGGGGDGNASFSGSPSHGTANTGSGGGSGHAAAGGTSGNGGSGIIIIKYATSSGISATGGTITTINESAKPTNVENNSILIEKNTADRYWFNGSTWTLET